MRIILIYILARRVRHPRRIRNVSMYVCVCNAVTDREIRGAVRLGARSLDDLSATLGVATCCRRCSDCARSVLEEALETHAAVAGGDD